MSAVRGAGLWTADILDVIADVIATEINEAVERVDAPSAGAAWKLAARRLILLPHALGSRALGFA